MTVDPTKLATTQALTNPFIPTPVNGALPLPADEIATQNLGPVSTNTMSPTTPIVGDAPSVPSGTTTNSAGQTVQTNASGTTTTSTTTLAEQTNIALEQILEDESNYVDNVLSGLRNPTYNFRLFMTTEHELLLNTNQTSTATSSNTATEAGAIKTLYTTLDGLPQYTIAQSGVTAGFVISDVEFTHACGPGWRNRNVMMTEMKITIVEPLGTSLFEALLTASQNLNVSNYNKMWYYLDLQFKGYDEDGSIDTSPLDGMALPNGGRWVYQINFTTVETHMSEAGSVYVINCVPSNLIGLEGNTYGATPDNIIANGTTINEFCTNFMQNLTKKWSDRYLGEIVTFDVNIMPIQDDGRNPGTFTLHKTDLDDQRNLQLSDTGGVPSAQIPAKTTIADVITFVYSYCEQAQQMIIDTNTPSELEDASSQAASSDQSSTQAPTATYNGKLYRVPIVPVIETDVKITGYDPITNQYMKHITYTVWSYRSYTNNLSISQSANISNSPLIAGTIANELIKRGYLKKRYEYQYTGLNTEVLRLNLDYNFAYASILPKITGWRQDFLSVSQNKTFNTALEDGASFKSKPNEISSPQPQGSTTTAVQDQSTTSAQLSSSQIQQQLTTLNTQIETLQAQYNNPTSPGPNGQPMTASDRSALLTQINALQTQRENLSGQATQARTNFNTSQAAITKQLETQGASNRFAEDAINGSVPLNLTYVQAHSTLDDGIGGTSQWHRGSSLVGAVFNQLMAPITQAMLRIDLEIRGDPYWIGYSALERRAQMSGVMPPPSSNSPLPNYAEGDSTFALMLRYPESIDPKTGIPIIRKSDTFNGMYRVTTVKNSFSNGEFKQTLEAFKLELLTTSTSNPVSTTQATPTTTPTIDGGDDAIGS